MTTRSKELFEQFKRDYNGQRLLKLYSPAIKPRLYLTVDEDGLFGFLLRTESSQKLPVSSNKLSISYKELNGYNHIQIGLLETRLLDIFTTICEDFVHSIRELDDTLIQASELTSRFISWCEIFKRANNTALTKQEQIGLYGELCFLKNRIQENPTIENYQIVESWIGSEGNEQDFRFNSVLHEVKCVTTRRSFAISISSERQLEVEDDESLILVVYIVDKQSGTDNTLNTAVNNVRIILKDSPVALSLFDYKLLEFGYFDEDYKHYSNSTYEDRETHFYSVNDEFPRIIERQLDTPIFNVRYQIQLEGIQAFKSKVNYDI